MKDHRAVSRRSVLRSAGLAAVTMLPGAFGIARAQERTPALRPGQTRAEFPVSDVMRRFSTYMSEARDRSLPADAIEHMKWHILDTLAAMVSGSELPPGRVARTFARAYGGNRVATIVADTELVGPIEAALVNGTMAHADETDDALTPGPWHPGCCVIPPALALGEQFGITGTEFLRACVLGYDIGTRVLAAVGSGPTEMHRAPYPLGGVFGAAAAGGSAAGFDAEQMRLVLAYCAESSAGIEAFPRDPDHIEKGFLFGGQPAQAGTTAVLLVRAGWTGVNDIFSGPENFLDDVSPSPNRELLVDGLGERFDVTRGNIKRWSVGFPIQAPLDALAELLSRQPIDPANVREIVLRYQPGSITDNSGPSDINVQYAVALMLVDKTATFRALHDRSRMSDPTIVRLRNSVRLVDGRGRDDVPPIQIVLADGTRLTQETAPPVQPWTRERVVAKGRELMLPVLGAAQTSGLIDRIFELEDVNDIRELRPLLQTEPYSGAPRLSEFHSADAPNPR